MFICDVMPIEMIHRLWSNRTFISSYLIRLIQNRPVQRLYQHKNKKIKKNHTQNWISTSFRCLNNGLDSPNRHLNSIENIDAHLIGCIRWANLLTSRTRETLTRKSVDLRTFELHRFRNSLTLL